MKKALPKLLIFFYVIPFVASLLLIGADALFNAMYLDWLWIPDWAMVVPYMLGYYVANFMIFAILGIIAYYIFFEKAIKSVLITIVSLLLIMIIPTSHYLLQHLILKDVMYDVAMLDYFYDFQTSIFLFLMNAGLFLIAALAVRAAYALFLMKKPQDIAKIWTPRHPVGLSAMLFYAVAVILATVLFIEGGMFTADTFLNLGLEYLLNILRFVLTVFAAYMAKKWINRPDGHPHPSLK